MSTKSIIVYHQLLELDVNDLVCSRCLVSADRIDDDLEGPTLIFHEWSNDVKGSSPQNNEYICNDPLWQVLLIHLE